MQIAAAGPVDSDPSTPVAQQSMPQSKQTSTRVVKSGQVSKFLQVDKATGRQKLLSVEAFHNKKKPQQ